MTTQVTIRNDNGHKIRVISYEETGLQPVLSYSSEYFLEPREQVQLHVWKNHSIRIEEGEANVRIT